MKEKLLAVRAARGDRGALESLVRQYYNSVYNYIFQRVHSRETAEDLTQDVFSRLTASIAAYRPAASFSAFLYRIAHNRVIDYYRTCKMTESLEKAAFTRDFSAGAERSEEKLLVQAMLAQLSAEQRECILLYYFHGLTYAEISRVLGIPVPTAKSRVRRGLECCRKWMGGRK